MINIAKIIPIFMVREFVRSKKHIDIKPRNRKNPHASKRLKAPVANGRPTVLETNLSILWSLISFITQPHDLTKIDPIITISKSVILISSIVPAKSKPRIAGHKRR